MKSVQMNVSIVDGVSDFINEAGLKMAYAPGEIFRCTPLRGL